LLKGSLAQVFFYEPVPPPSPEEYPIAAILNFYKKFAEIFTNLWFIARDNDTGDKLFTTVTDAGNT
jgi:hypothetical protein